MCSVDASGKQEMLDNWHNFDLTQVREELIKFILAGAVQYQVCTEHKYAGSQYSDYVKTLEAKDPIKEQENLVDLEGSHESKV